MIQTTFRNQGDLKNLWENNVLGLFKFKFKSQDQDY